LYKGCQPMLQSIQIKGMASVNESYVIADQHSYWVSGLHH